MWRPRLARNETWNIIHRGPALEDVKDGLEERVVVLAAAGLEERVNLAGGTGAL